MPTIQKKPLKKSPAAKKPTQNSNLAISTKDVEIKRLLIKINDLELEVISIHDGHANEMEEYQDYISKTNDTLSKKRKEVLKLQERVSHIESRCKDFTTQTTELLKLKNSLSLNDEFKIDFIIANFERMTLEALEKSLS